jgi:squalene-hopene/tetraprenyl-beta-curcumene cyclase
LRTRVSLLLLSGMLAARAPAAGPDIGPEPKEVQAMLEKGAGFLKKTQNPDGSFSPKRAGPGISALVATALLRNGYSTDEPTVAKTLDYLDKNVQKDGGIYNKSLANYTTCIALLAFKEANKDGKYDTVIKRATEFLKGLQHGDNVDAKDYRYGGVGYDGKQRPDLSNTQFFVEALLAAGVPKDDPAVQRAMTFVSRCQNLPSETNDLPFAKKTSKEDRGGLTYVPLDSDDNPHITLAGGLRSLGGMTYAGLKSFLYAGVTKDDPRVQGAVNWLRRNYTLDKNPGMGQAGLYYYYHTFAKAMDALGDDYFTDFDGKKHDWRRELFAALKQRQRPDGSWRNDDDKQFGENNADLATAFALLSLSYCKKK